MCQKEMSFLCSILKEFELTLLVFHAYMCYRNCKRCLDEELHIKLITQSGAKDPDPSPQLDSSKAPTPCQAAWVTEQSQTHQPGAYGAVGVWGTL